MRSPTGHDGGVLPDTPVTPGTMTPEVMELVAERFKVLAEPARLQLLNALRSGEMTVSELVEETGLKQANVSKQLLALHSAGFIDRRKEGLHVYYRIAAPDVFLLCDIMCRGLKIEAERRRALLALV
jgi:DNA-binding transcriptional ArsR family regulator